MTAQSITHPYPAADVAPAAGGGLGQLKLAAFVAACLILSAGARVLDAGPSGGAVGGSAAVFFAQASGTLRDRAVLADAPDGQPLRWLGVGERLAVGGVVAGARGEGRYWVEVRTPSGAPAFGFVPESAVVVTAGHVPQLRYDAAPAADWLAPAAPSSAAPASGADAVVAASAASGAVSIPWLPPTVSAHADRIARVAATAGVDPDLVAIVVLVESGGNPHALSPAGARGLMQLMPGTARDMARQTGHGDLDPAALADAETNLTLGAAYIAAMLASFGQADDPDWQRSVELAAAAYNGGPGHLGQHLTTGQPLFAETARYQRWVGGMWRERHADDSPTYRAWLAAGGQALVDAAAGQLALAGPSAP